MWLHYTLSDTPHIPTLPFGPSTQLEFLSLPFPSCCVLGWLPQTTHGVGYELKLVLCLWAVGYRTRLVPSDHSGIDPWAMVVLVACSSWWAPTRLIRGPVVHGGSEVVTRVPMNQALSQRSTTHAI